MKNRVVITSNNLPIRSPVCFTLVSYLTLHHFNAPEWSFGVLFTISSFWAIGAIIDIFTRKEIDLSKL